MSLGQTVFSPALQLQNRSSSLSAAPGGASHSQRARTWALPYGRRRDQCPAPRKLHPSLLPCTVPPAGFLQEASPCLFYGLRFLGPDSHSGHPWGCRPSAPQVPLFRSSVSWAMPLATYGFAFLGHMPSPGAIGSGFGRWGGMRPHQTCLAGRQFSREALG